QTIRAEQIIIATGSQAVVPDIPGLRDTGFLTNKEAIWLPQIPRRLAIVGGGAIGVVFAQMFQRFGAEGTGLEEGPAGVPKAGGGVGGYQFTHVAYEQGRLPARNAFAAQPQPFDDRAIPWVTYTTPELAHVGRTEQQLREEGTAFKVGRKPIGEVERAVATGQ